MCFRATVIQCDYIQRIPYSQALRLNRICSDPNSFDRRCNDLEKWLTERGYSEREIRKQILRAKVFQETPCCIEKIPGKNKTK